MNTSNLLLLSILYLHQTNISSRLLNSGEKPPPGEDGRSRSMHWFVDLKSIKLSLSWSANAFYLEDLCQLLNVVKSENFLNCWSSSLSMFGTRGSFLYLIQVIYHGHWLLIPALPATAQHSHRLLVPLLSPGSGWGTEEDSQTFCVLCFED